MALVQATLSAGLKAAFEKLAKSKDKEDNGNGVNVSPKAAKEIAKAYDSYAALGLAGANGKATGTASNFESALIGKPLAAGLEAAVVAYWVTDAGSITPIPPCTKCTAIPGGPVGFVPANVPDSQSAADALAASLHTYTTGIQVACVIPPSPSPVNVPLA